MKIQKLKAVIWAMLIATGSIGFACAADDVVIADFESETYGDWMVTGNSFGDGPAVGTLTDQMPVSGFSGKRLVNSYFGGDDSTGTLTSPPFKINRHFLNFLIGGGGHQGRTCVQLMIDGKPVLEATGTNTIPGGSEMLSPDYWDVSKWDGMDAQIQIIDQMQGGWGHINVDEFVLSDEKPATQAMDRNFVVEQDYLLIPIRNGAPKVKLEVSVDGKPIRRYETELATSPDNVDWYAYFTLSEHRGKTVNVTVSQATESGFALIKASDIIPSSDQRYDESLRPQFHFSQRVGWINDPNGMVYLDGEWHLYFQHNPVGWSWGNMTWGHAVSSDLIHWKQLPNVLFPGTMAKGACFSGGAVVDAANTGGWKSGEQDTLVAFLTDTGAGEAIAFSNDRGRTFTWHDQNPVVKHKGRDPKVVWYAYDDSDTPVDDEAKKLDGHWVMAVYDESPEFGNNTAFYTSTNLKDWTPQSHLPGYFECPELFELSVSGVAGQSRWVTFAADGKYAIGQFDGRKFTPDHEDKHQLHHGEFYASQTFDHAPDGRRIQIGWIRIDMPGMPFNQAFSFPHQLTLKETKDGIRMFAAPVQEIEKLRGTTHSIDGKALSADQPVQLPISGELFELEATFELGDAKQVGIDIGGNRIVYDTAAQTWMSAFAPTSDRRVQFRALIDRSQLEIWGNDGAVVISGERKIRGEVNEIVSFAEGGTARLVSLKVHELKSIWER